jgi:hypothetical protein
MKLFNTVLILSILGSSSSFAADSGLSPSSVQITIYSVSVSSNADCSNASAVATYPGGQIFDFEANPTIFSGAVPNGTYPCVILQMSDQITFVPATTSTTGNCVTGTPVTTPVCNSANGQKYQQMTVNVDNTVTFGAVLPCTAAIGNAGEVVPLVLSTASTLTHGNLVPFIQPSAGTISDCEGGVASGCGINLVGPFVVSATTSGTFVVNFQGQVADQGGECGLEAPTFSFR